MRTRHIGLLLLAAVAWASCDDSTATLGIDMLPQEDGIATHTTTYTAQSRSVAVDSVYAKTSTGYVGAYTDPKFGYYEASFLTELNCTNNYRIPARYVGDDTNRTGTGTVAGDTVASVDLVIYYEDWFGDSLNACRLNVYELNRKLERNRYTDIEPEQYYDPADLLTSKAYTAFDTSVPDSVRFATDDSGNSTYYPHITLPLSKELGNELLRRNWEHPEDFADAETFIDRVFKGVYIENDYGDGTILYIDRVDLQLTLCFHVVDSLGYKLSCQDGSDSLQYLVSTAFSSTKEVLQASRFQSPETKRIAAEETGWTYLKSPAGIFTEITLPYEQIAAEHAADTINAVRLSFTNYRQDDGGDYAMQAPQNVLLLRKEELGSFFEENQVNDNLTSFLATHNAYGNNEYTFSNIARLVTTCINEKNNARLAARQAAGDAWDEAQWEAQWKAQHPDWDKVLLIPVNVVYDTSTSSSTITSIEHDLSPSYVRLQGGPTGEELKVEVTYTSFNAD